MPGVDGHEVVRRIRKLEEHQGITRAAGAKVIMTTSASDSENVMKAFGKGACDAYLIKPIDHEKLISELVKLSLIPK